MVTMTMTMLITMMIMIRMTMTMTMMVVMSCGNSTSYVLIESPSTSQNSFCYRLYFLFSYKRSAALGQFVIHRGLIISVMQVGWHALNLNSPYSICKMSWLTSLPLPASWVQEFFSPLYSRTYWKDKTLWQLKKKKEKSRARADPDRLPQQFFLNKVEFVWVWLDWI